MVNVTWVSMTDIFAEPLALTESQTYGKPAHLRDAEGMDFEYDINSRVSLLSMRRRGCQAGLEPQRVEAALD